MSAAASASHAPAVSARQFHPLAAFLSYLFPGLGQIYQGRIAKGILFFVCVYLLPSLTCEERERGVLLAQALSPAAPREILAAKFLVLKVLRSGGNALPFIGSALFIAFGAIWATSVADYVAAK